MNEFSAWLGDTVYKFGAGVAIAIAVSHMFYYYQVRKYWWFRVKAAAYVFMFFALALTSLFSGDYPKLDREIVLPWSRMAWLLTFILHAIGGVGMWMTIHEEAKELRARVAIDPAQAGKEKILIRKMIVGSAFIILLTVVTSAAFAQSDPVYLTHLPIVAGGGAPVILAGEPVPTETATLTPTVAISATVTVTPTATTESTATETATPNAAATDLAEAQATLAQSVDVATVAALQTDIANIGAIDKSIECTIK